MQHSSAVAIISDLTKILCRINQYLSGAKLFIVLSGLLVSLASVNAQAESFTEDDRYIVHYNAFNSSAITPDIAKVHNLVRSGYRGMVNITVQRKRADGPPTNVTAFLDGKAKHLNGTEIPLEFTQINEGEVVYYIGEFQISNGQPLTFDIDVKPGAEHSGFHLKFSKTLFVDEK